MAAQKERERLKTAYSSPEWAEKVDQMSDAEVIAVTRRLQEQNIL